MPVPELAAAPVVVVVVLAPAPVPELAAPLLRVVDGLVLLPPIVLGPALPGVGSDAPICPPAVPGPMRPALSVSAGEPCAAYAPVTATAITPAANTIVSFLMNYLPEND